MGGIFAGSETKMMMMMCPKTDPSHRRTSSYICQNTEHKPCDRNATQMQDSKRTKLLRAPSETVRLISVVGWRHKLKGGETFTWWELRLVHGQCVRESDVPPGDTPVKQAPNTFHGKAIFTQDA